MSCTVTKMRIRAKGGILYFVVGSVVLLFTMIAIVVDDKWEKQEPLLAYPVESGMISHGMAELSRIDHILQSLRSKKTLQYQELDFSEQRSTYSSELKRSAGANMYRVADALLCQANQMLLDCSRKNHVLHVGGDEKDLDTPYARFWGLLFNQHQFSRRRSLARTSGEKPAPSLTVSLHSRAPAISLTVSSHSPAPAPTSKVSSHSQGRGPSSTVSSHRQGHALFPTVSSHRRGCAPSPTILLHRRGRAPFPTVSSHGQAHPPFPIVSSHGPAPVPSPTISSPSQAPTPSPTVSSPSEALAPSPTVPSRGPAPAPSPTALLPSAAPSVFPFPTKIPAISPLHHISLPGNNQHSQPTGVEHGSDIHSSNQNISKRTVAVAVAATAFVTIIISALFFLLWICCFGTGSRQGRANEKPLVWLCPSSYSTASLYRSFGLGTVANGQVLQTQSFYNNLDHNKLGGNFCMESHSLGNSFPVGIVAGAATQPVENSLQMPSGVPATPGFAPVDQNAGRIDPATPPLHNVTPAPPSLSGAPGLPPVELHPGRIDPPTPPPCNATPPSPSTPAPPPPPPPPTKPSSGAPCPPPPPPPPPLPTKPPSGTPCPRPGPPPPPPVRSIVKNGLHPPSPPSAGGPPPQPPLIVLKPPRSSPLGRDPPSTSTSVEESEAGATKAKLKPFFWDKVSANPDHSMVWDHIRSGSFHFNEEMIENLFGYEPAGKTKTDVQASSSQDAAPQHVQLIDPKKSQNLSIMLRALNVVTEDVCYAIEEGNKLPPELIQTLLKMRPTTEEEINLRKYAGDLSQLGPAEQFLKFLIDIPFAFKRLESLLFVCTFQEDISVLRESFAVLEAACTELQGSRLFLKLLEAILKTGNHMNDGTFRGGAQAFKLDTLLKLSDVKGTDGKTTLLHFVVQEIIFSEGRKAARLAQQIGSISSFKSDELSEHSISNSDEHFRSIGLQLVSSLGNELENVKKAAVLDVDSLTATVTKLRNELAKVRDFLDSVMKNEAKENGFCQTMMSFLENAEADFTLSVEKEEQITALIKSMGDYFHGNAGKDEGLRLFKIVRDFLTMLDKVCKEVKTASQKRTSRKKDTAANTPDPRETTAPIQLFPGIPHRQSYTSSSDDE